MTRYPHQTHESQIIAHLLSVCGLLILLVLPANKYDLDAGNGCSDSNIGRYLRGCLESNTLIIKYVHFVVLCDVIPEFSRTEEKIQSAVRYPSGLTNEEGEILEPIINELESYTIGRPRKSDFCDLLNAIFYLNKTGYPWRYLPKDFPPYKLVNYYYNKWTDNRLPEKVNTVLHQRLR